MAEWRTPVFDRTMDDVKSVDRTSATYQKGALNADDLNRIEGNFQYVVDKLFSNAMMIPHTRRNRAEVTYGTSGNAVTQTYTDWQEQNIPWKSEIDRIRENFNNLVDWFLRNLNLPVFEYRDYVMYTEVNDWERITQTGKDMFENMEKEYVLCGTLNCGGDRLL